jgi:hypothetical protein
LFFRGGGGGTGGQRWGGGRETIKLPSDQPLSHDNDYLWTGEYSPLFVNLVGRSCVMTMSYVGYRRPAHHLDGHHSP